MDITVHGPTMDMDLVDTAVASGLAVEAVGAATMVEVEEDMEVGDMEVAAINTVSTTGRVF